MSIPRGNDIGCPPRTLPHRLEGHHFIDVRCSFVYGGRPVESSVLSCCSQTITAELYSQQLQRVHRALQEEDLTCIEGHCTREKQHLSIEREACSFEATPAHKPPQSPETQCMRLARGTSGHPLVHPHSPSDCRLFLALDGHLRGRGVEKRQGGAGR